MGACATRNRGIEAAKGAYVTFLDDDDEYDRQRLEVLMDKLLAEPQWSFVCSDYHELRPGGPRISRKGGTISLERVLWLNVTTPSVLTRKDYLLELGGFDTQLSAAQDYDLFTRLIKTFGPAYRVPQALYIYHQEHLGPRITTNRSKRFRGYYGFYCKFKGDMTEGQRAYSLFRLLKVLGKKPRLGHYCRMVPWRFLPLEFNTYLLEETSIYLYLAKIKSLISK
jgi:glycosyltransferase involved in cell wall biosynthesis